MRSEDSCDPVTGDWTLVQKDDNLFVACTCKYPNIITQKFIGSNCDVDVACGPIGSVIKSTLSSSPNDIRCRCPYGYKSIYSNGRPSCIPMTVVEIAENNKMGPCREDEIDVPNHRVFGHSYFKGVSPKCTKRPCSFDALTGKPIKKARFVENWGCVCDPKRGNVGVRINHPDYLSVPGYNACINIFNVEPLHDIKNIELYTYYYMFDNMPVSFIQYRNLNSSSLAPLFKSFHEHLQIEETWPHSYMQRVFEEMNFTTHTRHARPSFSHHMLEDGLAPVRLQFMIINDDDPVPRHFEFCDKIPRHLSRSQPSMTNTYRLFYRYPVCKMPNAVPVYGGHFVSNPFHVTFRTNRDPVPDRSNGLMMRPDDLDERLWHVYLAPSDRAIMEGISLDDSNVPNFNDKISVSL